MARTKLAPARASGARFSPSSPRKDRTIRSAAPLSIRHLPITAAKAMTMPILAVAPPKASATRCILSPNAPGARRLTSIAAMIRAIKALTRRTMIRPTTVTIPNTRITSG